MAHALVALGEKGDALTKQVKCSIALSTCEDLLNVFVKEGKAYIVVDPFEAWVMDQDTDDDVAKALRPFLSQGADKEGSGDKTPKVEVDLAAERLRIDQLIKSKEELEAANKKVQDERKAAMKKAQSERKAANLAKTKEEKAVSVPHLLSV